MNHFIEEQDGIDVHVINMIDATADYIRQHKNRKRTHSCGTDVHPRYEGKVSSKLEDCDIKTVCIPDHLQIELDKAIFDSSFGIKAHSTGSKTATEM